MRCSACWAGAWAILETFKARFGAHLCESRISETVSIAESPYNNQDVFAHAPSSRGAADYRALFEELEATGFFGVPRRRVAVPELAEAVA
jgi:chromosome partitioning protein